MSVRSPELDMPGLTWFNTDAPLSLDRLRGRPAILDFWTFCCINCLHVLPTLRQVEDRFGPALPVIGIHSPKFDAERDPENVAQAIRRYDIRHPVAHDPERLLWQRFAVRAWPTLVFLDRRGYVIGQFSGEPDGAKLMRLAENLLAGGADGSPMAASPPAFEALLSRGASTATAGGRLSFPGKIKPARLPDGAPGFALADAGHNRILLLDARGGEVARFGNGSAGLADGDASTAAFRRPEGLVAGDGALFVADTGNHALRRIDLATGRVTTLAGIGRRGGVLPFTDVPGQGHALASPWDLEMDGRRIFIANAGTHQIAACDIDTGLLRAVAGSGAENIHDGPAREVPLAQPSGLAWDAVRRRLYFADSETSSIRLLLPDEDRVETLVGQGLFVFGHINGRFADARLQHPLGLALAGAGLLLVADSYNGAVRMIDLEGGTVRDLDEGQFVCTDPVCRPLAEPAGVTVADGRILVSDTNNHRVIAYDPARREYGTWCA